MRSVPVPTKNTTRNPSSWHWPVALKKAVVAKKKKAPSNLGVPIYPPFAYRRFSWLFFLSATLPFLQTMNKQLLLNFKDVKFCSDCKQILAYNQFRKEKNAKDALAWAGKKCERVYAQIYNKKNVAKIRERRQCYYQENKNYIKKQSTEYYSNRIKIDPKFKLNKTISKAIRDCLKHKKHYKNGRHWETLIGYSIEDLIKHLENLFQEGMTWDNHGQWHIDHKKPINLFEFHGAEYLAFKKCWALANLQPLWAQENRVKHTTYKERINA